MASQPSAQTRRAFLQSSIAAASTGIFAGKSFVTAARAASDSGIEELRAKVSGTLILPSSPDYADARRTFSFNPRTDVFPLAIVVCKNEDDVMRSLEFARTRTLPIAVRSGGHDVLGASTVNAGIIIDLSGLNTIEHDVRAGVVTAGAGIRAGRLNKALEATNQVVALGCNPQVGVGGLTLGGGLGWLLGTAGAACDNVISAKIVTSDLRLVTVSAGSAADLFWAIRGGGGNFGIATSITYSTQNAGRITGGWIVYPGERLREILQAFKETMRDAPRELVVELAAFNPSRPLVVAIVAYCGDPRNARAVLDPLRNIVKPLADDVALQPYTEFAAPGPASNRLLQSPPSKSPPEKTDRPGIYWMGASTAELTDGAIDTIAAALANAPQGGAFSLGHYMHGAICDVPEAATPLLRARGTMTYHFDIGWGNVKHAAESMRWVDESLSAMAPFSKVPTYVNYLGSDEIDAVKHTYGANFTRLAELKKRYDPDNVLRRNRNIPPANS